MRIAIATAAAALVLACAFPARAGDEFEDAFKSELGRLAAQQAVSGAQHLLTALVTAGVRAARASAHDHPAPEEWEEPEPRRRSPRYERDHGHHLDRLHDPSRGHYDHTHGASGYHCHP
jgi:hypothetical protein